METGSTSNEQPIFGSIETKDEVAQKMKFLYIRSKKVADEAEEVCNTVIRVIDTIVGEKATRDGKCLSKNTIFDNDEYLSKNNDNGYYGEMLKHVYSISDNLAIILDYVKRL